MSQYGVVLRSKVGFMAEEEEEEEDEEERVE